MNIWFILNSVALGVGLAMDAFSVSIANGLAEPGMGRGRRLIIAGTYAAFQFAMPLCGWILVRLAADAFDTFRLLIPWIALVLLCFIGGKMLAEGIRDRNREDTGDAEAAKPVLTAGALILQGIATSIDALSVGFAITDYTPGMAFCACVIIAVVTLAICLTGLTIGRAFGMKLAGRATIVGGVILIFIGAEIFLQSFF